MSRQHPPQQKWEEVSENSSFMRFCFRYVEKDRLVVSEPHWLHAVEQVIECLPLAKKYFLCLQALEKALQESARIALKELALLSPSDFREFAARRLGTSDPDKTPAHLRYLFLRLIESGLENTQAVSESLRDFGALLTEGDSQRISGDGHGEHLHRLQARFIYDCSDAAKRGPLRFGDILKSTVGESEMYYLLITPECDLEVRSNGRPKAEVLLLVEGTVVETEVVQGYVTHTPLVLDADEVASKLMRWNLRRPRTIEPDTAMQPPYERWGRLKNEFAERIQQRFSCDLLEVGTEETISGVRNREVALFGGPNGNIEKGTILLSEYRIGEKTFWAFCDDCVVLFNDIRRPLVAPHEVHKLQRLQLARAFRDDCRSLKLIFVESNGRLAAIWRSNGTLDGWVKPISWEAAKEFVEADE